MLAQRKEAGLYNTLFDKHCNFQNKFSIVLYTDFLVITAKLYSRKRNTATY